MIPTSRLTLRPFEKSDLDQLAAILSDPLVMRFSDHGALDSAATRDWLARAMRGDDTTRLPMRLAVQRKLEPALVGYVSLTNDASRVAEGDAELGFRCAQNFWGNGYATEAAIALIDHARASLNVTRIVAIVDPNNAQSVRVLEKLGLGYSGEVMFDGYDYPDHRYTLLLR